MSKKHAQRTRAEILAKRGALHAAQMMMGRGSPEARRRVITTAAARRVMRSKYKPHDGTEQLAKDESRPLYNEHHFTHAVLGPRVAPAGRAWPIVIHFQG